MNLPAPTISCNFSCDRCHQGYRMANAVMKPAVRNTLVDKRSYQRILMRNLAVDAYDGVGFLQGTVSDVSRFGICVTGLQRRRGGQPEKMTFVVSGEGKNFKMTVSPRWSVVQGAGKFVGALILDPPLSWTEFVMSFEPGPDSRLYSFHYGSRAPASGVNRPHPPCPWR